MATPIPITRRPADMPSVELKACKYCCVDIPAQAKKCRSCGEWVVGTSRGFAAGMLRALGILWALVTVLAAGGLWYLGQGVRRWAWMHAIDQQITPQLVDVAVYAVIAIVLLKGFMVSVGLGILARMSPSRPRWYTW